MASRSVQLRVGGQTYRVVSSADEEELGRLAAVVDAKLAAVVPPGRAITPQALLLAALGTNGAATEAGGAHTHALGVDGHAEPATGTGGAAGWRDPGADGGRERPIVERRGAPDRRELSALVDRRDPPTRPSGRS